MKIKKMYVIEFDVKDEHDVMDAWCVEGLLNDNNINKNL